MTGDERRKKIIEKIKKSEKPVPARQLAEEFKVSRQVIVQDMALIRAEGNEIIATNRGYVLKVAGVREREIKVHHTDAELEDEMNTIVDFGGMIRNVSIRHRIYGEIEVSLNINSRKKVKDFIENIKSGKSSPLKNITSDYHYHLIEAESDEILDSIEEELDKKGYLIKKDVE